MEEVFASGYSGELSGEVGADLSDNGLPQAIETR